MHLELLFISWLLSQTCILVHAQKVTKLNWLSELIIGILPLLLLLCTWNQTVNQSLFHWADVNLCCCDCFSLQRFGGSSFNGNGLVSKRRSVFLVILRKVMYFNLKLLLDVPGRSLLFIFIIILICVQGSSAVQYVWIWWPKFVCNLTQNAAGGGSPL